ncbi:MAG TPA: endonuclease/exonuclease/phosphatase family protein, partial [Actinomycetota bacterium]
MRGTGAIVGTALLLVLAACTSDPPREGDGTIATPDPSTPIPLEIFVYNVEYGGDETTDAVIEAIDADVVGVLESYNRLSETAERTGYPYHNTSLQILSKYPIHEPSGAEGRYAFIEVRPGEVVAFFNIHLDYVRYGPRLLRNGRPLDEVLASEDEVRTSALDVPLRLMEDLVGRGYPVFLTGDHNEPSHLDYGADTVGTREGIEEPVPWPVSIAITDLGFRDTYREIHPDPLEDPGISHFGAQDRIDFLYAAGPSETLDSRLVGEEGGDGVDDGFDPWTSDHR